MPPQRFQRVLALTAMSAAGGFLSVATLNAMWSAPNSAPVGRLVANVARVARETKDPKTYYTLGRIHSAAFHDRTRQLNFYPDRESGLPNLTNHFGGNTGGHPLTRDELAYHLDEALIAFAKVIELKGDDGRCQLSIACVLEEGAEYASRASVLPQHLPRIPKRPTSLIVIPPASAPATQPAPALAATLERLGTVEEGESGEARLEKLKEAAPILFAVRESADSRTRAAVARYLAEYWRELALGQYRQAFDRSYEFERGTSAFDLSDLVSHEAAQGYIRLVEARGPRGEAEIDRLGEMRVAVEYMREHASLWITPIVISIDGPRALRDLLSPDRPVRFDLNGDGTAELWPWVKPTTGFLVWDPERTGIITSGQQLFGNATWWMMFKDGYAAMEGLDDNGDGQLAGDELTGLAVWFDRNSNGVSDRGEVVDLDTLGIESLAVFWTSHVGKSMMNPTGLRMKDGRVLPTYDWVTEPWQPEELAVAAQ